VEVVDEDVAVAPDEDVPEVCGVLEDALLVELFESFHCPSLQYFGHICGWLDEKCVVGNLECKVQLTRRAAKCD